MMTDFRAVRLGLDYFASLEGRRQAKELCALFGAASIPSHALTIAKDAFQDRARGALAEARIEGSQEALLRHLVELWHMTFMVELKRQRLKAEAVEHLDANPKAFRGRSQNVSSLGAIARMGSTVLQHAKGWWQAKLKR